MKSLLHYQKEAVEKICSFFNSDKDKAKIYISAGLGKTAIIISAVQAILVDKSNTSIAVLTSTRMMCEQIRLALSKEDKSIRVVLYVRELSDSKMLITTYQDVFKNQLDMKTFDLIICDEAQFIKRENFFESLVNKNTKCLGIFQDVEDSKNWFDNAMCLFSYSIKAAIKDGYSIYDREQEFTKNFLLRLLDYQGYKNINRELAIANRDNVRVNVAAEKDTKTVVIQVKYYRNLYNSETIINNALQQILQYKYLILEDNERKDYSFVIVVPCKVDVKLKNEIYNKFDVTIWDVNNLIYLCEESKELLQLLLGCISYSFLELKAEKPLGIGSEKRDVIIDKSADFLAEAYIRKLENCKPGKLDKADRKYEIICTEIINQLFGTEFYRVSKQHKTSDEMFRMDLLCSLKGTTEFWKFLISFYQTKFVVFEYKNYSDYIAQDLIYTTEKYLFSVALRKVAFIISRKGFDSNAKKAAIGCLKENGKLIVSLDDNDLIKMLAMKENGEEPSDYLLDKVEELLMSVSK